MSLTIVQIRAELRHESDECLDKLWYLHALAGVLVAFLLAVLGTLWSHIVLYAVLVACACAWWVGGWVWLCKMRRLGSFEELQERLMSCLRSHERAAQPPP